MSYNQSGIRNHRVATLSAIKAIANANEKTICFCDETKRFYHYVADGSGHTANDIDVLTTGAGGDTRWIDNNTVGLFEIDINGGLMPTTDTSIDDHYELDSNGDIMPTGA